MIKKYEAYKESGVEWIGEIPKTWKVSKLKYYAQVVTGNTPSMKFEHFYNSDNGTPWIKPSDLNQFKPVKTSKQYLTDEGLSEARVVREGSILIGGIGDIGKLGIAGTFLTTNQQIHAIEGFEEKIIDSYLKFLIYNSIDNLQKESSSVVLSILTKTKLLELNIIVPSIIEQTQIAAYLDYQTDLIDLIIEKKQLLIQKLKAYRQSIINEAVTKGLNPNAPMKESGIEWLGEIPEHWEVVKFRYKLETNKGLTITKENLQDKGIPCVNYGEIHSKFGFEVNPEIHNLKCVSEEYIETNKSSLLTKGDFVFADTSEDIKGSGNFTHLNSDIPTFAGYHTIIARLIDNSDYRFFAYFFDSSTYRTQIQNLVKGVKVYSITNKILKDSNLLCPPLEEQRRVSEYLDIKIEKLFISIEKLEKSIQKLKSYRQSIISEAVTGKIDVRDWEAPKTN